MGNVRRTLVRNAVRCCVKEVFEGKKDGGGIDPVTVPTDGTRRWVVAAEFALLTGKSAACKPQFFISICVVFFVLLTLFNFS